MNPAAVLRVERGFAVPTILMMLMAAFVVASAAAYASISSQSGTNRDLRAKSAFAVAESGISDAMLRYNLTAATVENPCLPVSAQGPDAQGWCQPVTNSSVNGGSFTYWVHPPSSPASSRCAAVSAAPASCLEVVSVGALSGVTRRVAVTATSSSGRQMFGDAAVKAQDGITLDSNAIIKSNAATNGDIVLSSNAKQCGQASVGVGQQLILTGNAHYYSDLNCTTATSSYSQADLILPPVNQGDAASNNNNSRFFALDPASDKADACWNGLDADGTSGSCGPRELLVAHNSAVTLGGSVYSFCKLTMEQNTKLYVAAGVSTVIYFDSPEACGYATGSTQLELRSNSRITPANTSSTGVALLFVGSTSRSTNILLNSNTEQNAQCSQNYIVYAPLTDLELDSNAKYCGAMAGKTIHLDQNAEIRAGSGTAAFNLPNTAAYYVVDRNGFIECSTTAASPPNSGC